MWEPTLGHGFFSYDFFPSWLADGSLYTHIYFFLCLSLLPRSPCHRSGWCEATRCREAGEKVLSERADKWFVWMNLSKFSCSSVLVEIICCLHGQSWGNSETKICTLKICKACPCDMTYLDAKKSDPGVFLGTGLGWLQKQFILRWLMSLPRLALCYSFKALNDNKPESCLRELMK